MSNLISLLNGSKTYLTIIAGLIYILGAALKWWPFSLEVLGAFGFTSQFFLRLATGKAHDAAVVAAGMATSVKQTLEANMPGPAQVLETPAAMVAALDGSTKAIVTVARATSADASPVPVGAITGVLKG